MAAAAIPPHERATYADVAKAAYVEACAPLIDTWHDMCFGDQLTVRGLQYVYEQARMSAFDPGMPFDVRRDAYWLAEQVGAELRFRELAGDDL